MEAICILNEMFAARDLAREVDKPPLIDPYLEQLLRLVETHIRMEELREASAEVASGPLTSPQVSQPIAMSPPKNH
jgi:hypothetical protein